MARPALLLLLKKEGSRFRLRVVREVARSLLGSKSIATSSSCITMISDRRCWRKLLFLALRRAHLLNGWHCGTISAAGRWSLGYCWFCTLRYTSVRADRCEQHFPPNRRHLLDRSMLVGIFCLASPRSFASMAVFFIAVCMFRFWLRVRMQGVLRKLHLLKRIALLPV